MPKAKRAKSANAPKQKATPKKRLPRLNNSMVILLAREYYRTIMPARRSHRTMIWVAFFAVWAILVGQFLYPLDRAVPFASIGDDRIAYATHDEMAKRLTEKFNATKIKLMVDNKQVEYPLKSAGAELNTEELIAVLIDYPFWQRFIPLSILWQTPRVEHADVYYADVVLKRFSESRSKELSFAPTNARLAIKDGTLVATPEKKGSDASITQIHKAISTAEPLLGAVNEIVIHAKRIPG